MPEDFWGVLVPPLVGKSFYTLKRHHEFRVEEMSETRLRTITSTGKVRWIPRWRMEDAWNQLTAHGSITLRGIEHRPGWAPLNWSYWAALLAQMPGVEHRLNPITLIYREAK